MNLSWLIDTLIDGGRIYFKSICNFIKLCTSSTCTHLSNISFSSFLCMENILMPEKLKSAMADLEKPLLDPESFNRASIDLVCKWEF